MNEIIYGIRNTDGKVISIYEVPNSMSGLACNCVCASCGKELQACSLSGKVSRYFRHHNENRNGLSGIGNVNCNPNTANESALHQMAKQIIAQAQQIVVPCRTISLFDAGIDDLPEEIRENVPVFEYSKSMTVKAESVEIEKRLQDFTPDVIVKTLRGELLVEIFVSHQVDENKEKKAKEYGAAMLEIDLSVYAQTSIKSNDLCEMIINSDQNKKWIYYPLSSDAIAKAKNYYENTDVVKMYRKSVANALQKKQRDEYNKRRRNNKIRLLFDPQYYSAELKRMRDDDAFLKFFEEHKLSYWYSFNQYYWKNRKVPFFVDIPITGEMIFQCDRRIWQSVLFVRFIYGRKEVGAKFDAEKLYDVLRHDYQIEVDFDLSYKLIDPRNEDESIWLRREVIKKYMNYLEILGFIFTPDQSTYYDDGDWKTVQSTKTIVPPNNKAAKYLVSALNDVDLYSPDINRLIDEKMQPYFEEKRKEEAEARERAIEARQRQEEEKLQKIQEDEAKKKAEQLEREKEEGRLRQEKYTNGYNDVLLLDFSAKTNRYDRYGERWVKCSLCNCIKRAEEMSNYKFGMGECRKC